MHGYRSSFDALHTDRYLDPPVEQNYTNKASGGGASARVERDLSDNDRIRLSVQRPTGTSLWVQGQKVQPNSPLALDTGWVLDTPPA